jgi:hypothetical protein
MIIEIRALLVAAAIAVITTSAAWPQKSSPKQLILSGPFDHIDSMAREPMVVQAPSGALFVGGYGPGSAPTGPSLSQPPHLWTSLDRGASWTRVNVGTAADGALGNSDTDLAVARDGTLYFANLGYDPPKREGDFVTIGVSRDAGQTWSWKTLSKNRFDDRPWVKVAPDGTAHLIWNDGAVHYRSSRDRGATWSEPVRLAEHGGSSHLAVGPNGEVAVRIAPASASGFQFDEGVDLIAVSVDQGKTWRTRPAPGEREWVDLIDAPVPRWVEPLAWGPDGALYSLWTNAKGLWMARSRDQGETWKIWQLLASGEVLYYPYLVAGPRSNQLAAAWFSGKRDAMQAHVALFEMSEGDAPPRVFQSRPFQIDSWTRPGQKGPVTRSAGGEYLGITFLQEGGFGVVSPIYNGETKRAGFSWWRAELP